VLSSAATTVGKGVEALGGSSSGSAQQNAAEPVSRRGPRDDRPIVAPLAAALGLAAVLAFGPAFLPLLEFTALPQLSTRRRSRRGGIPNVRVRPYNNMMYMVRLLRVLSTERWIFQDMLLVF
jgi:hypothetical protein